MDAFVYHFFCNPTEMQMQENDLTSLSGAKWFLFIFLFLAMHFKMK